MATDLNQSSASEVDRQERLAELIAEHGEGYLEHFAPGSLGSHELLDRSSWVADLVERTLLEHPACIQNGKWYALTMQAVGLLNELYQSIGRSEVEPAARIANGPST